MSERLLLDIIREMLDRLDRIDNRQLYGSPLIKSEIPYKELRHKDIVWLKNKLIEIGEGYSK